MAETTLPPHTTTQGETWDMIALKVYGSEYRMTELMRANPDYADVVIFGAGTVLTCPVITEATTPSTLPPWSR